MHVLARACLALAAGCGSPESESPWSASTSTTSGGGTSSETAASSDAATDAPTSSRADTATSGIFDVHTDDTGGTKCECGSEGRQSHLFVSNSSQGTLSKIDTVALAEVGRYQTRADLLGDPSRTSVSLSALKVAVANRSGGVAAFWTNTDLCDPLTNGTAGLQTSTGKDDVLPWGGEDCLAWYTEFDYFSQRPIAWAAAQNPETCEFGDEWVWTAACPTTDAAWVVHRLDGETGAVLATVPMANMPCELLGPYGGAVDLEGSFWLSSLSMLLVKVDAETLETQAWDLPLSPYGITIDATQKVWLSSNDTPDGGSCAARFDPVSETFDFAVGPCASSQSGIQQDALGRVWMNYWTYDGAAGEGLLYIDPETMAISEPFPLGSGLTTKGVSVDRDGYIWSIARDTGQALRLDPDSGTVESYDALDGPYTYSDMTGWALFNALCEPAG